MLEQTTRRNISVRDIFVALGEAHDLTPCMLKGRTPCDLAKLCAAHGVWTGLQKVIEDYLMKVTLKDILMNGEAMLVELEEHHDLSI